MINKQKEAPGIVRALKQGAVCAAAIVMALLIVGCGSAGSYDGQTKQQKETAATAEPAITAAQTEEPVAEPGTSTFAETDIRPEVKEFLDAYEAYMDEYIAFVEKYMAADSEDMVAMMGDYYSILARYTEFAEKIEAMDESELTNAEMAYYIEVTSRVSQKLLNVAG